MLFYQIKEKLVECSLDDIKNRDYQYVALVARKEFEIYKSHFDMGIDLDIFGEYSDSTELRVNYDSLTGCFSIPERKDFYAAPHNFQVAIDEKGIVFINDDGTAKGIIDWIHANKKWKIPCLERFIYDFLEGIVHYDLQFLLKMGREIDKMEDEVLDGEADNVLERLSEFRGEIIDLRAHYDELISFSQELEENENHFFESSNLRFFRLFTERVERLQRMVMGLREQTMQIRDLYHSKLEEKQNKKMALLTAITMIFTPLTLITSWYGMNFKYMPELNEGWAYPMVLIVCIGIALTCIIIFKKKKWF